MPKNPVTQPRFRYRLWLTLGLSAVACVSTAWAAKTVRSFLATDPRFSLQPSPAGTLQIGAFQSTGIGIAGAHFASRSAIQQAFSPDFGRSVFLIPIAERRRRLLAIDWVENATVSRIWPDRILVRIRERKPVAFLNIPHQGFLLVDADGVLLSPPPRANFEFPILSGVSVDQTEADRKLRVQASLRLLEDLGPAAKDISEVNAASLDDLRIMTDVQGKAVELWLGNENFGSRYHNFMEHVADIQAGSPRASVFDLRIDDRITAK